MRRFLFFMSLMLFCLQTGISAQIVATVHSEKTYLDGTRICYFEINKRISEQSKKFLKEKAESNQKIMQLSFFRDNEQLVMFNSVVDFTVDSVVNFINNIFAEYPQSYSESLSRPQYLPPSSECFQAMPFCTDQNVHLFPAAVNVPSLGHAGCLTSTPNPAWFWMEIDNPGDISILISSNFDVDFIAWGPYPSRDAACAAINIAPCSPSCPNNTTNPGFYPFGNIVDCSYSAAVTETCRIRNAQRGEVYVLLITNFANRPTNISFQQISGSGSTNCGIITPPASNNGPLCIGETLQLLAQTSTIIDEVYNWTGPNGFTSTEQNPIISNVTTAHAGTYTLIVTTPTETGNPETTTVVINEPSDTTFLNDVICSNNLPYTSNGFNVSTTGEHILNLTNNCGCDSVAALSLTVNSAYSQNSEALTICSSELPLTWRDTVFEVGTTNKQIVFIRQTSLGCDSIVTLDLVVKPAPTITILEDQVCENDSLHLTFTGDAPFTLNYTFNGTRQSITIYGMDTALVATQLGENEFIVHSLVSANGCSMDNGVEINGLIWATSNVALPNTFTSSSESAGMFYQWDSNIGWSVTNPMIASNGSTTWNTTPSASTSWQNANNPCPNGYRVPTNTEYQALVNVGSTWAMQNGVAGRLFGSGANAIFLPALGYRSHSNGAASSPLRMQRGFGGGDGGGFDGGGDTDPDDTYNDPPMNGYYWSSTQFNSTDAYYLLFGSVNTEMKTGNKTNGFNVRCVKDIIPDTILVTPIYNYIIRDTICQGKNYDKYNFNLINVQRDTILINYLQTDIYGCDSIIRIELKVNPSYNQNEALTICSNELPLTWRDTVFEIGTIDDTFIFNRKSKFGCDSIVTLDLVVKPAPTITILEDQVCENDSLHLTFTGDAPFTLNYTFNGTRQTIIVAGMDTALVATQLGENEFIVHSLVSANGCSMDNGVEINGLLWATSNVAFPNTFASSSESAGMFYQWDANIGWSVTNPMIASNGSTTWNTTPSANASWQNANNPCPSGYRVPTNTEYQALIGVSNTWTMQNSVTGRLFGSGANTIFLPALGYRNHSSGAASSPLRMQRGFGGGDGGGFDGGGDTDPDDTYNDPPGNGYYWSSTQFNSTDAYYLLFGSVNVEMKTGNKTNGFNVRCVKDIIPDTILVTPIYNNIIRDTICQGEDYIKDHYNIINVISDTILTDTLQTDIYGCDSIIRLELKVMPVYNITFHDTICQGQNYNNYGFELFNVRSDTLLIKDTTTNWGCDSIVNIELVVTPIYNHLFRDTICQGDDYNNYGFTLLNAQQDTILVDSLKTNWGCDSIVTLELVVKLAPSISILSNEICQNDSIQLIFTGVPPFELDYTFNGVRRDTTILSTNAAFIATQLGENLFVVHRLTSDTDGCSIITGVEIGNFIWATQNVGVPGTFVGNHWEPGMLYQWNKPVGWSLTDPRTSTDNSAWMSSWSGGGAVTWEAQNNVCPEGWRMPLSTELLALSHIAGAWETIEGQAGRWFGSGSNRIFLPAAGHRGSSGGFSVNNGSFSPAGNYWSANCGTGSNSCSYMLFSPNNIAISSGSATWAFSVRCLKNVNAFISVMPIEVIPIKTDTVTLNICENDLPFVWRDTIFEIGTIDSIFIFNRESTLGCDSIVTLELIVSPVYNHTFSDTICYGEDYNNYGFFLANVQSDTLLTDSLFTIGFGCDSVVNIELVIMPIYTRTFQDTVCKGDDYIGYGFTLTNIQQDTILVDSLKTDWGCDSIINLELFISSVYDYEIIAKICLGSRYNQNGFDTIPTTTGVIHITNIGTTTFGCDSIVTLKLTVDAVIEDTITAYICLGERYNLNNFDTMPTTTGTYYITDSLLTSLLCDSIVTLELIVSPVYNQTFPDTICQGDDYIGYGFTLLNVQTDTLLTDSLLTIGFGCDSIVNVELVVMPIYNQTFPDTVCQGDDYIGYGFTLLNVQRDTILVDSLFTDWGCDSVVNIELVVMPIYNQTFQDTICYGKDYNNYGFFLANVQSDTLLTDSLFTNWGCDSVVNIELIVMPIYIHTFQDTVCKGDDYVGYGFTLTNVQTDILLTDSLLTNWGCDSVVNVELVVMPIYTRTFQDTVCKGDYYIGYGFSLTNVQRDTILVDSLKTDWGCDSVINVELVVMPIYDYEITAKICLGSRYNQNGFDTIPTATGVIHITNIETTSFGCDSIVTLKLTVDAVIEDTIIAYICLGERYNLNNFDTIPTTTGTHYITDSLLTSLFCDSIVTLELIVSPVYNQTFPDTICQGDDYVGYGFTLLNVQTDTLLTDSLLTIGFSCDSIVNVELVVMPIYNQTFPDTVCYGDDYFGYNFFLANVIKDTILTNSLTTDFGCDSIVNLKLIVMPIYTRTFQDTVCKGDDYIGYGFSLTNVQRDTILVDSLKTDWGCDSVINLELFISPVYDYEITAKICLGSRYNHNGFDTIPTEIGIIYITNTKTTAFGCDSIVTLKLTVDDVIEDTITAYICIGERYNLNNFDTMPTTIGTYYITDSLLTLLLCDSIVTLELFVMPVYNDTIQDTICFNHTYTENGFNIIPSAVGTFYYTNNETTVGFGCDSLFTVELTIMPIYNDTIQDTICLNGRYTENGFDIIPSVVGTFLYTNTETTDWGCDSLFTVELTIMPTYNDTIQDTICFNSTYTENNFNIIPSVVGTFLYTNTETTDWGCDSLFTVELTIMPIYNDTIQDTICFNDRYTENGFDITPSSAGTFYYTNSETTSWGCDSLFTVELTIMPTYNDTIQDTICLNGRYTENGFDIIPSVVGTFFHTNIETTDWGCDSLFTVELTIMPIYNDTIQDTICLNGRYTENGFDIIPSVVGTFFHTNTETTDWGCDSLFTVELTIMPIYNHTFPDTICQGDNYIGYGFSLINVQADTLLTDSLFTNWGCDSVVNVELVVMPIYTRIFQDTICKGDNYSGYGFTLTNVQRDTILVDSLKTDWGCDSIINLELFVSPVYNQIFSDTVCYGDDYFGYGFFLANVQTDTLLTDGLFTNWGCDSVVNVELVVMPIYNHTIRDTVCKGDDYTGYNFNLQNVQSFTTVTDSLHTDWGCDSIVHLELFVMPTYDYTISAVICIGESYNDNNFYVISPPIGTHYYTNNETTAFGCDSTVTLKLTVGDIPIDTINIEICGYESYFFNGNYYNQTGLYTDTLRTSLGCDSIVTLDLFVKPAPTMTIVEDMVCENDTLHLIFTGVAPFTLDYTFNNVRQTIIVFGMDTAIVATQTGANIFITHSLVSANGCSMEDGVAIGGILWATRNVDMPSNFSIAPERAGMFYQWDSNIGWSTTALIASDGSTIWNTMPSTNTSWQNNPCPSGYRVPTYAEYQDLINTSSVWTVRNGVAGRLFGSGTSQIFLPARGLRNYSDGARQSALGDSSSPAPRQRGFGGGDGGGFDDGGDNDPDDSYNDPPNFEGYYWSSTSLNSTEAHYLHFNATVIGMQTGNKNYGFNVRCVKDFTRDTITVNLVYNDTIQDAVCYGEDYNNYNFYLPNVQNDIIVTNNLISTFGCDSIVTLKLTVNPIVYDTIVAEICENDSYFFNGNYYSLPGSYTDVLQTIHGCDSIVTLELSTKPAPTVTIVEDQVCENDSLHLIFTGVPPFTLDYTFNGVRQTIVVSGMDIALIATQLGNNLITIHSLTSDNGCTMTSGLGINGILWATRNVDAPNTFTSGPEIVGMFYQWDSNIGWTATEPMTASDGSTTWNTATSTNTSWQNNPCPSGYRVPTNAEYQDLMNMGSVWTTRNGVAGRLFGSGTSQIFLPAHGLRNYTDGERQDKIPSGSSPAPIQRGFGTGDGGGFDGGGDTDPDDSYNDPPKYEGYYWSSTSFNSIEAHYLHFNATSIGMQTGNKNYGFNVRCVRDLVPDTILVTPIYNDTIQDTICRNDNYTRYNFNLQNVQRDTVITQILQTDVFGCDSIFTVKLFVMPIYNDTIRDTICQGENYTLYNFNLINVQSSTIEYQNLQTGFGCDSIVRLELTVNLPSSTTINDTICSNHLPYTLNGFNVSSAGSYQRNEINAVGCDSTIYLNLVVTQPSDRIINDAICSNNLPYTLNGFNVSAAGSYQRTTINAAGCDSTIYLNLVVNQAYEFNYAEAICAGRDLPFVYGDTTFLAGTTSGIYTLHRTTALGCDSVIKLTLTVNHEQYTSLYDTIVQFNPYNRYGFNLPPQNEAGDFVFNLNLQTSDGCDSVVTLYLRVVEDIGAVVPSVEICATEDEIIIEYTVFAGVVDEYSVEFDSKAHLQGLTDIPRQPTTGSIVINNPRTTFPDNYLRPDIYTVTVTFYGDGLRKSYTLQLSVLYPAEIIEQKWNNVLALYNQYYNGGYTFSSYQWFVRLGNNSESIPNSNHSYIYLGENVPFDFVNNPKYRVLLTRTDDGMSIFTCEKEVEPRQDVTTYPSIVDAGRTIYIPAKTKGTITIRAMSGVLVSKDELVRGENSITAPMVKAAYIMTVEIEGETPVSQVLIVK